MMKPQRQSAKPALLHFCACLLLSAIVLSLFKLVWFPKPYGAMSGANELMVLVLLVDVVCGPLLTFIIYRKTKTKREKTFDFLVIASLQVAALAYGLWTAHLAMPRFLVHEIDRFKLITNQQLRAEELKTLQPAILEKLRDGVITVGLRKPRDAQENSKVLFESLQGGRDLAERPDFYLTWESIPTKERLDRARKLIDLINNEPTLLPIIIPILNKAGVSLNQAYFLPLMAHKEWVVLLDASGNLFGYLQTTGFIPHAEKK